MSEIQSFTNKKNATTRFGGTTEKSGFCNYVPCNSKQKLGNEYAVLEDNQKSQEIIRNQKKQQDIVRNHEQQQEIMIHHRNNNKSIDIIRHNKKL